jgi:hypothetical protein
MSERNCRGCQGPYEFADGYCAAGFCSLRCAAAFRAGEQAEREACAEIAHEEGGSLLGGKCCASACRVIERRIRARRGALVDDDGA